MLKAKILVLSLCATAVLFFAGCNPTTGGESDPAGNPAGGDETPVNPVQSKVVDLRNKNSSGVVYNGRLAGRVTEDELLDQELVQVKDNPQNLTEKEIEDMISFYDSAAGIKVLFTTPDRLKDTSLSYLQMNYIDGTGKWSTQVTLDDSIRNEGGKVKPQFDFEYPLVIAGKESQFAFQITFSNNYKLTFIEKVTPKHGKGRVDDLPEDFYDNSKYTEFKDGVIKLSNVVPPEATSVKKSVSVICEKNKNNKWSEGRKQIAGITKEIEYGHDTDFYFGDIESVGYSGEALNLSDTPYCFVFMTYSYTMKNFDGLNFSTPCIETVMMDVDFFKTPVEERSVSKTVIDGKKVTFEGNGYFDGLYEGDIKVPYKGESFIPALFVKGLDVYILAVENGNYIGKDVKTISEFLGEGGSFANVEGDTVYVKLKTDSSEANLDKSDKTEITVSGNIYPKGIQNADEVEVKVEDNIFKWVTKPLINVDYNINVDVKVFKDYTYAWVGTVSMPYDSLTDFDLTKLNFDLPYEEIRKNGYFVVVIQYVDNKNKDVEFAIRKVPYILPDSKFTLNLKYFDSDSNNKIILTEGGAEANTWRYKNFPCPDYFKTLKKGDIVGIEYSFTTNADTNMGFKICKTNEWEEVSSGKVYWNETGDAVKKGQKYTGIYQFMMKRDMTSEDELVLHIAGSYNDEGTTLDLNLLSESSVTSEPAAPYEP